MGSSRRSSGPPDGWPIGLGTILDGKYRLDRRIGSGGMGVVFEATHLLLDRRVAVKLPLSFTSRGQDATQRFVREARSAFLISHPNVVRVLDLQISDSGLPYIVMECLEGQTLAEAIAAQGTLPLQCAVRIAIEVAKGVAAVHRSGIVHRDLKPSNIFLSKSEEEMTVKVLDLGIAKAIENALSSGTLEEARLTGSPPYMSPEQLQAGTAVDHRSDIWSLGVILYAITRGSRPFFGETSAELSARILADPPAIGSSGSEEDRLLDAVVLRCLSKDPEQRYPTIETLRKALVDVSERLPSHLLPDASDRRQFAGEGEARTQDGTTTNLPSSSEVPLAGNSARGSRGAAMLLLVAAMVASGLAILNRSDRPTLAAPVDALPASRGDWKEVYPRLRSPPVVEVLNHRSSEGPRASVGPEPAIPSRAVRQPKQRSSRREEIDLATDTRL